MKTGLTIFRFWLCLLPALAFSVAAPAAISPDDYHRQLQQLSSRVEQLKQHPEQAGKLEFEVPDQVSVRLDSGDYAFRYDWLKVQLKQFQHADVKTRAGLLPQIQERLRTLEQQAQAYEKSQIDMGSAHNKISQILTRHEFSKAKGPGFLAIWWAKILRWISDFMDRHPIYGRSGYELMVYLIVAVAFIMFAIWITRRFRRPQEDLSREILPFAPSDKGWRTWLAEAQASAKHGGWRDGIHLAYWAGIAFLEEHGAWRPDRARTPREYLRMLGTRKPEYPTLSVLTRKFEVVWYGHREANAADFQETIGHLEKLGCR